MEKVLIILRGLPGAGKSTVADLLSENGKYRVCTADDFFIRDVDGETKYCHDENLLGKAHEWCQGKVKNAMELGHMKIFVANTSAIAEEMNAYYDMANEFGYNVISMIVENRHNGINNHDVPDSIIDEMRNVFDIKL